MKAFLRGVGLWTPSAANVQSWREAGAPADLSGVDEVGPRPPATLLHSRLRRRTSTLTRAAVTALEEACAQGGAALDELRIVLVSSYGEIETTVDILEQLAEPEDPVSPTKFHNSVHNTATGYMSIAAGNRWPSTALAAGARALEVGMLEAMASLLDDTGPAHVVVILAEERLPPPFDRGDADPSFAAALHFAREPGQPEAPSSLDCAVELREVETPTPTQAQTQTQTQTQTPAGEGVEAGIASMLTTLVPALRAGLGLPGAAGDSAASELVALSSWAPLHARSWNLVFTGRRGAPDHD